MGTSYPRDIIVPLECDSINIYTNLKRSDHMARLSKEERLRKLEEQIKKKKQMMKEIEQSIQISIGKTVMKEWGIDDDEIANEIIKQLKDQAKQLLERKQSAM